MAPNNWLPFPGAKCAASFMERCIIFIGENANECVKTNAFLTLTKEAIIKIISSDYVRKPLRHSGIFRQITPSYHKSCYILGHG